VQKNTIWIVVTLMAIALIGLSWFQLYWMNNVIQLSKERFEKDALASMYQVAQRLERNEMAAVAVNSFAFFGAESGDGRQDTMTTKYDIVINGDIDASQKQFKFKTNSNSSIRIVIASDSSEEIHEFVSDTSFAAAGAQVTTDFDQESAVGEESVVRLQKKHRVFAKVVEEMMFHEVNQLHRVHPDIIDSLLKVEFRNHGIYLTFEFGIYDTRSQTFKLIKTGNKENLKDSPLRASLFPNDILGNTLSLMVSFPDKNEYLFNKIWTSLLISVVFILMIIGTFSYVVYKIIHQKKVSDLKNDFINNMTHEFKTPIATVSLATEALQEEKVFSSQATMLRYIGVIQQESKRLGTQVEKVLQLASMEKDNLSLNKKLVRVDSLIETATERAQFQIEEGKGSLTLDLNTVNIEVMADEMHFSNAIFNLLDNAIKYSRNIPEIRLRTSVVDGKLTICVEDKGIGLSKSQQQHIFEKFYRVPTGNLHDVKGFGLGLNYVKYIVEAHDGKVVVDSQLGAGSKFSIILPVQA
jgi:two-component system, OmpR family, phosphate regulon sensor histidine kinase PhoR